MEASSLKTSLKHSFVEVDANDAYLRKQSKTVTMIDTVRIGITTIALLCGITILGLAADALSVYNSTRVQEADWLSLWPSQFDLRPTVALLAGSCIVTVANIAGLLCSKVPHVSPPGPRPIRRLRHIRKADQRASQIRNNTPLHTPMMFAAPFVGFVAALIAIIFFYATNASATVDTLLSWTCRWKTVSMTSAPYFGTLCQSSWASVVLAVVLVPLEAVAFCVAGWQLKTEKHVLKYASARQGSQSPGA